MLDEGCRHAPLDLTAPPAPKATASTRLFTKLDRQGVRGGLARASLFDTLAFLGDLIVPTLSKGLLLRRPRNVALIERAGLEARAVRRMPRLRRAYGCGILLLAIPGRRHALVLSPDALRCVLAFTPEPYAPATR